MTKYGIIPPNESELFSNRFSVMLFETEADAEQFIRTYGFGHFALWKIVLVALEIKREVFA